ncbi:MAG TPA: hypothetical protein VH482_36525 [Thermomicrobiales bacterium]|jgi:hypothetical protein
MGHHNTAETAWQPSTGFEHFDWSFSNGADVVDVNGERLGYVVGIYPTCLVFTRGLSLTDYVLPLAEVASFDDATLYLRTAKGQALDKSRRAGAVTAHDERCLWRHHS